MNKTLRLATAALALSATMGMAVSQPASALQFSYTAGIQVQNLSASNASVNITFYNTDGSTAGTINDSIGASGSKTFFPLTQVASGFNGSAIISSDQQVAAVVNVLGNGGVAGASYVGQASGNTTVNIPLLMKNNFGYNTWMKVQNVGTGSTTVNVAYSDGTSASRTIAQGASDTFNQADETHSAAVFAATITSGQPVVATVIEEDPATMFAYNGFSAGSTRPVMPLVNANNFGVITGIQLQNGGGAASTVTVSYTPAGAGAACSETQTINAGQSATFALSAFQSTVAGEDCANGATFIGSAQVSANSANVPLVAIVNQVLPNTFGEAYGSFDASAATNTIVMPLIMDRNFGYYTGFNVQNVGAAATNVTCSFTGTPYTVSANLAPGQALNDVQNNKIGDTYVGSGTCVGDAGSKLVGVVNEVSSASGDTLLVYEALSK
jgi:hypothetical protein